VIQFCLLHQRTKSFESYIKTHQRNLKNYKLQCLDILQLLAVGILGAEIETNFFLEIRRGYDRTNRIEEIPSLINEKISEVKDNV